MTGADQRPSVAAPAPPGTPGTPAAVIFQCAGLPQPPDAGDVPAFPIPLPAPEGQARPDEIVRCRLRLDSGGEYRGLRFRETAVATLDAQAGGPMGLLLILVGAQVRAQVRPSPRATGGTEDVVDLVLEDGTVARRVPRTAFSFEPEAP
jgi:hypothetical protein